MDVDPDAYDWVSDPNVADMAAGGCILVAQGMGWEDVISATGDSKSESINLSDGTASRHGALIAGVNMARDESGPASVLIQVQGTAYNDQLLTAASKRGKSARVCWDVNGLVMFECAERGQLIAAFEVPYDADGYPEGIPPQLVTLFKLSETRPNAVGVAMAMAEEFTGVPVPCSPDVARPAVGYVLRSTIPQLPLTREDLINLEYPSPEIVAAVLDASAVSRWRLAAWSARQAVDRAGLVNHPDVQQVLSQFRESGPGSLRGSTERLRGAVARSFESAERKTIDGVGSSRKQSQARGKYWAMEAIAYTAVQDDVTAALGATYCAGILYYSHVDGSDSPFLKKAAAVLAHDAQRDYGE